MKNKGILKQLAFFIIILAIGYGYRIYSTNSNDYVSREHRKAMKQDVLETTEGTLEAKVRYRGPSQYGEIVVFDYQDRVRCFLVDGANESCWNYINNLPSRYTIQIAELIEKIDAKSEITSALVIGYGGGTLLKRLGQTDYSVDIVEINEKLVDISEKYFFNDLEENHKLSIGDGRFFLENSKEKYDVIILDICNVTDYSLHLWTKEFYKIAAEHLTNEGVLIVSRNVVNTAKNYQLDGLIANAMLESFNSVVRVEGDDVSEGEYDVGVFIALKGGNFDIKTVENRSISTWDYDAKSGTLDDQNSLSALDLFYPTTVAIKNQVINNFGEEILFQ